MSKTKRISIEVQGTAIAIVSQDSQDFISLTDMAKKFGDDVLIYSWMRNRNTLEFIGIWEKIHNPDFKGLEFETFRDRQTMARCQSRSRRKHPLPRPAGTTRRPHQPPFSSSSFQRFSFQHFSFYPMFSVLIRQGLPQPKRLATLNEIAITQMRTLLTASIVKRLK